MNDEAAGVGAVLCEEGLGGCIVASAGAGSRFRLRDGAVETIRFWSLAQLDDMWSHAVSSVRFTRPLLYI